MTKTNLAFSFLREMKESLTFWENTKCAWLLQISKRSLLLAIQE
jgi:hypothetical protein